jgi:hypothetical protein
MAVFGVQPENTDRNAVRVIEEIARQAGRYISSNEGTWRIFSFPMHEHNPAAVHLAIHLENRQRVYFTDANVRQRALNPPSTTLTAFRDNTMVDLHPNLDECIFLCMVLVNVPSPRSFQQLVDFIQFILI